MISKFYLFDADGTETDLIEYDRFDEAKREAERLATEDDPVAVIEYEFEFAGSELAWSSNGANHWPPSSNA